MEDIGRETVNRLCSFTSVGWAWLPSAGAAGGILMFSDKEKVECVESWVDIFSISMVAKLVRDSQLWVVTGVHGPTLGARLESFIDEMQIIRCRRELPLVYRWRFNEVLYLEERSRATRRTRGMNKFSEFVESNDLINLPISGARYTWSNSQERLSMSKLDRFFISIEWDDYFSPNHVYALPRVGSDHVPIVLKGGEDIARKGPVPFKFQNMWLLHPGFVDLMKRWWENIEANGLPSQRFQLKLKGIKDNLKTWNREVFGNIITRKKICLEKIQRWDLKEGEEGLEEDERLARKDTQKEYERVLKMEEIMWRQKSRV